MDILVILQYGLSIIAILISVWSFLFARKSWQEANRPIVVAYIEVDSFNDAFVTFNLILSNIGNRPAINIQLLAKNKDIEKIFEDNISKSIKDGIFECFKKNNKVALLKNDMSIVTAFGHSERVGEHRKGIAYDSWLPIKITYRDLNCKEYTEKMSLKMRGTDGFGGSIWKSRKN